MESSTLGGVQLARCHQIGCDVAPVEQQLASVGRWFKVFHLDLGIVENQRRRIEEPENLAADPVVARDGTRTWVFSSSANCRTTRSAASREWNVPCVSERSPVQAEFERQPCGSLCGNRFPASRRFQRALGDVGGSREDHLLHAAGLSNILRASQSRPGFGRRYSPLMPETSVVITPPITS